MVPGRISPSRCWKPTQLCWTSDCFDGSPGLVLFRSPEFFSRSELGEHEILRPALSSGATRRRRRRATLSGPFCRAPGQLHHKACFSHAPSTSSTDAIFDFCILRWCAFFALHQFGIIPRVRNIRKVNMNSTWADVLLNFPGIPKTSTNTSTLLGCLWSIWE